MNEQSDNSPPPPTVPIRTNRSSNQNQTNSSTNNLAHSIPTSISQQQFQNKANISPSSSFTSSYNLGANNAVKLAQKSANMGSMQSLDHIPNNLGNGAFLVANVAGKTHGVNSTVNDAFNNKEQNDNQNFNAIVSALPFCLLNGENVVDCEEGNAEIAYVFADNRSLRGRLIVTNFRLFFRSYEPINILGHFVIDMPLGYINRIEKIGHQSSKQQNSYGIVISSKDGRRFRFANAQETRSRKQVFDILQKHAFPLSYAPKELNLFAYSFKLSPQDQLGWNIYDAEAEYKRMGITELEDWRFTDVNKNYDLCDSYPKVLVVPKSVKDDELKEIAEFRSKERLPVLSWIGRDKSNQAAIVRSSQPCCGIANKQSKRDEEYLAHINKINMSSVTGKLSIMDARPQVNAIANRTKGGGYENEDNYEKCEVTFLNIQNIHVMRESLRKVYDMATTSDDKNYLVNLDNSKWLDHLKCVLVGANKVVSKVHQGRSSVLVHCSDGWDRTAQLTSLSMIMLDKYYRTIKGFEVLVEKEWLSFGHKFSLRMGHGVDKHSDQDRSPIFIQFIDCVWQLLQQYPKMFEFNEDFLLAILKNIYTCQFGTFLYNCEYEREKMQVKTKTVSLWTYLNSNESEYKNCLYNEYDGVITYLTSSRTLRLWTKYYFQYKESNNDILADVTQQSTVRPHKNIFSQMIHQMKISKNSTTPSEPVLVRYKSSVPTE